MTIDDMARAIPDLQARVERLEAQARAAGIGNGEDLKVGEVRYLGIDPAGQTPAVGGENPTHAEVVFLDQNNVPNVRVLPLPLLPRIDDFVRTDEPDEQGRPVYRYAEH